MKQSSSRQLLVASLWVVLAVCIFSGARASAQQAGLSVAPAQLEFNVSTEHTTQTQTIEISNSYDVSQRLSAELQAIDETGVRLVPNGALEDSFAKTIKLSATDIVVPAKGKYRLQVAVDSSSLSGGGHYASLVLTQQSNSMLPQGYKSAIAINLFVIKDENIRTDLKLVGSNIGGRLFSLPSSGVLTFKNLGNTHVVPRGSISLYSGNELVSKAVINQASVPLFPEKQAAFAGPFDAYRSVLLPKKLRVLTMYRIDGSDIQYTSEKTVLYVPVLSLVALIGLFAGLWLLFRRLWKRARTAKKYKNHKNFKKSRNTKRLTLQPTKPRSASHSDDSDLEVKVAAMMDVKSSDDTKPKSANRKIAVEQTGKDETTIVPNMTPKKVSVAVINTPNSKPKNTKSIPIK